MNSEGDFKLELSASESRSTLGAISAGVIAVVLLVGIVFVVRTDLAAQLLPMREEYLQILIPQASDGAEPLSLQSMNHQIEDNRVSVTGMVSNRTDKPVPDLIVVLTAADRKIGRASCRERVYVLV